MVVARFLDREVIAKSNRVGEAPRNWGMASETQVAVIIVPASQDDDDNDEGWIRA